MYTKGTEPGGVLAGGRKKGKNKLRLNTKGEGARALLQKILPTGRKGENESKGSTQPKRILVPGI